MICARAARPRTIRKKSATFGKRLIFINLRPLKSAPKKCARPCGRLSISWRKWKRRFRGRDRNKASGKREKANFSGALFGFCLAPFAFPFSLRGVARGDVQARQRLLRGRPISRGGGLLRTGPGRRPAALDSLLQPRQR